ncbi:MAG: CDGSH iron-sulfur domain-containing protein [Ignavibacteriales bacterium]|nr:CDGSH iron-sulfur domain-containing protein [Ignavibacteriales bacterium]
MANPDVPQKSPYGMEMEPGTYFWCACGKSDNQPFCDGSHKGTEFTPLKQEIGEKKTYYWCGCKQTGSPPFCDGSHKEL